MFFVAWATCALLACDEDGELIVHTNPVESVQFFSAHVAVGHESTFSVGVYLERSAVWYNAVGHPNCGIDAVDVIPLSPQAGPVRVVDLEVIGPGLPYDDNRDVENAGCFIVLSVTWSPAGAGAFQFALRQNGKRVGTFEAQAVEVKALEVGVAESIIRGIRPQPHMGYVRGGAYLFGVRPEGTSEPFGNVGLGELAWRTEPDSLVLRELNSNTAYVESSAEGSAVVEVETEAGISGRAELRFVRGDELESIVLYDTLSQEVFGDGDTFYFDPQSLQYLLPLLRTADSLVLPDEARIEAIVEGEAIPVKRAIPTHILHLLVGDICVEFLDRQACIQTVME